MTADRKGNTGRILASSYKTPEIITMEEKKKEILNKIKSDPIIMDLKLSCYMAACNAISKEAPLIPSPKDYIRKLPLKEALDEINESIPNVSLLRFYLENPDIFELSSDTISVLHWLLVKLHEPYLLIVKDPEDPILELDYRNNINEGNPIRRPDLVLKFSYSPMSIFNVSWKAKTQNKKTYHGFTPVRLQDLHAVIHRGPKGLEDKGCLGYGLTLCSELGHAIKRAEASWIWGKSTLASKMYAVLAIEFVDTAKAVLRLARRYPVYFLISDSEFARIKYLLLWITEPPAKLPVVAKCCATVDINLHQRIIFSMLLILTYLILPKRTPTLLQKTFSVMKERFFQHKN